MVSIRHKHNLRQDVIGVAIIDDHSTVSMVNPKVAKSLNLDRSLFPSVSYDRFTVGSNSVEHGLGNSGLLITPINSTVKREEI